MSRPGAISPPPPYASLSGISSTPKELEQNITKYIQEYFQKLKTTGQLIQYNETIKKDLKREITEYLQSNQIQLINAEIDKRVFTELEKKNKTISW